ncbi:MAG: hypothetical protein MNSN_02140 [Minisyncoccus archaeiphilus]|uniref:hypothetical protein n=1 Tax=Minisyncoccus archaeiphilus TaxID=3238481 RepID=UPI002B0A4DBD|nr:MAG: hypothetical protein MNSN_02140 [Candidatus Parcubacteria bacterium]
MINVIKKIKTAGKILIIALLCCYFVNLITLSEEIFKITTIIFFTLIASLLSYLVLSSISSIKEESRARNNKNVIMGYVLLFFPLILPVMMLIGYITTNYSFLSLSPLILILAIPILPLTEKLNQIKKDTYFKLSYFVFVILLPVVIILILASSGCHDCSANNAKIKASMSQMRSTGELFRISRNEGLDYKGLDSKTQDGSKDMQSLILKINSMQESAPDNVELGDDNKTWCYKVELLEPEKVSWCVDSNGYVGPNEDSLGCLSSAQEAKCFPFAKLVK